MLKLETGDEIHLWTLTDHHRTPLFQYTLYSLQEEFRQRLLRKRQPPRYFKALRQEEHPHYKYLCSTAPLHRERETTPLKYIHHLPHKTLRHESLGPNCPKADKEILFHQLQQ